MHSVDLTVQNFQKVVVEGSQDKPVLIDIWAPWCGPCKTLKPLLEKLAEEYQGKFMLAKLNSDENQSMAQQFGVRSIPTVKVIYKGKLINEFTGALPESELRKFIDSIIPSPAEDLRAKAALLRKQGQFEQALELINQALLLDENNTQASLDKAALLLELKRLDEALQIIESLPLPDATSDRARELLTRIEVQQKTAGLADSATLLKQIEADPANLQARLDLANLYIAQQQYPEALEQCFAIIKQDRDFEDDVGRRTVLDIFTLLGSGHELVRHYRRQLSTLLN